MKQGILLAGGLGTRLRPLTTVTNKHFLPIYDKPLIYYSLSTLILSGIKHLVLVSDEGNTGNFKKLLSDGSQWGLKIEYGIQKKPEGIPQALTISEQFLNTSEPVFLTLGDNLLYGRGLGRDMNSEISNQNATIYCFQVSNPSDFGIAELSEMGKVESLEEKPIKPKSNLAITGFYNLPSKSFEYAKKLKKSKRGEFEIIDLLRNFLEVGKLRSKLLPRGTAWLDAGSADGLLDSSQFVRTIQGRQGLLVGSPDEAAWRMGNISIDQLLDNAKAHSDSQYGKYLKQLIQ